MITETPTLLQPRNNIEAWQLSLAQGFRDPDQLFAALAIPVDQRPPLSRDISAFPLRVPLSYVTRIRQGDPHDPLLRQILPLAVEDDISPDYTLDPVADLAAVTGPGLLQKYHGRALLITTGACAIHCRYCFRRHFPYADNNSGSGWRRRR